jgi:SOUL heme-binding protein
MKFSIASVIAAVSSFPAVLGCSPAESSPVSEESSAPASASSLSIVSGREVQPPSDAAPVATLDPAVLASDSWTMLRVGGDMTAKVERTDDGFRFEKTKSRINTPLPVDYPEPTPPGAIDLKKYPTVRRAQVTMDGSPDRRMGSAFWPLFQHISRRDIEMTSPVEMDLHGLESGPDDKPDSMTMSFLYRFRDQGPLGKDEKDQRVEIVDTEPTYYLSLGVTGAYRESTAREKLAVLQQWLKDHPTWEQIGSVRTLGYNGPDTRTSRLWGEVQIPVRRIVATSASAAPTPAPIQPSSSPSTAPAPAAPSATPAPAADQPR